MSNEKRIQPSEGKRQPFKPGALAGIKPDNGHFLDVSRQIYQMPTKTSMFAFLEKLSLAYGLSCSFSCIPGLKRILRRKLKNPGIEGALDYAKGR